MKKNTQPAIFFDVHTHTQFTAFKDDKDAVIERARERRVWMTNVGTQRDTSQVAIDTKSAHAILAS